MGKYLCYAMALAMAIGLVRSTSLGAGNWTDLAPHLDLPAHISAGNRVSSSSVALHVQHDGQCTLQVSVAQAGDEVLHNGAATLTTSYRLTGASLAGTSDSDWVSSNVFRTRTYTVYGGGPVDDLTLEAQAAAPGNSSPDPGVYSATIILTLSW